MLVVEAVYDAILEHARRGRPEEVCGLLAGTANGEGRVTRHYETSNVAAAPRRTYAIDPEEQYRAMTDIDEAGLTLLGFYHSHPNGPSVPSPTDEARATWAGYAYLIVSLERTTPVLDAWEWTGNRFEPVPVTVDS